MHSLTKHVIRTLNCVGAETRACMFSNFVRNLSSSGVRAKPTLRVHSCLTIICVKKKIEYQLITQVFKNLIDL